MRFGPVGLGDDVAIGIGELTLVSDERDDNGSYGFDVPSVEEEAKKLLEKLGRPHVQHNQDACVVLIAP